ncbi:MAG: hypothetical protein ACRD68_00180, partial [Pyrinomonadaceae bacterium]
MLLSLTTLLPGGHVSAQGTTPAPDQPPGALQTSAVITATPNPVPAGAGTGTAIIYWRTGSNMMGRVYVSENGGPERLFASGTDGTSEAPWIGNGSTYVFRLYAAGEGGGGLLASVEVQGTGEMAGGFDFTRLASKALNARRLVPLLVLASLLLGACGASTKGRDRLAGGLLVTAAALATTFTLLSVLTVEPRPFKDQPYPDAHENADAARQLLKGHGLVTFIYDNQPR